MTVSPLHSARPYRVEDPRVYLTVRDLPADCQPCRMVRERDGTLIAMQRGVPAIDVVMWMTSPGRLTTAELNAIRAAFQQPPVGQHADEASWAGFIGDEPLPEAIRLPAERDRREESA